MLYLVAGSGAPNFGDELIVAHWLRFYREQGYSGPITVDGRGSKPTARLLRQFGDVSFVSRIPRHAGGEKGSYADFSLIGREYARANAEAFRDTILIHFCGGGYLTGAWRNATRLLGTAAELKAILKCRLAATGAGVAPIMPESDDDRRAYADLIGAFDIFECRDRDSHDALAELSGSASALRRGLDDSFLFPIVPQERERRHLHLSAFEIEKMFGSITRETLGHLMDQFDETRFWLCSPKDRRPFDELKSSFPRIRGVENSELLGKETPIATGDFMVTARFHPHLLAARVGMAGYFFAGSEFYRVKHQSILDLGSRFRRLSSDLQVFIDDSSGMPAMESRLVAEKRRIADIVLSLL